MKPKKIKEGVFWAGAVDWDRRLFDALVPLPDGTSYNAYLVYGKDKTVLLDTVDPSRSGMLMQQLEDVKNIDFIVSHHAEQDHSGTIPEVLSKYGNAKVIASPKGKELLIEHLRIPEGRVITVNDRDTLDIGGKTLEFIHAPWVHWPETMLTYIREDRILFTCDLFGSHLASSGLYEADEQKVCEAAKRYYAEVVMPFVTMHGSTQLMVDYLAEALYLKGIKVEKFNLSVTDLGKFAMSLVDAATIVIGSPAVLARAHPVVISAAYLANALS